MTQHASTVAPGTSAELDVPIILFVCNDRAEMSGSEYFSEIIIENTESSDGRGEFTASIVDAKARVSRDRDEPRVAAENMSTATL